MMLFDDLIYVTCLVLSPSHLAFMSEHHVLNNRTDCHKKPLLFDGERIPESGSEAKRGEEVSEVNKLLKFCGRN